MMLPRGYIPTHTACADILLLPFSLHILRAVTADSTYAIFARMSVQKERWKHAVRTGRRAKQMNLVDAEALLASVPQTAVQHCEL